MAEDMDNIVVLTDEDGHDVQFEHIVTVTHKNKEYVCLIPIEGIDYGEDEDENALIFLEIIPGKDGADDVYQGVEDEKLSCTPNISKPSNSRTTKNRKSAAPAISFERLRALFYRKEPVAEWKKETSAA